MQNMHRICCGLLGTLCVAAMAVAQGPDAPVLPAVVVPEPPVAASLEVAASLSEDTTPFPSEAVTLGPRRLTAAPPQVISSAHSAPGCQRPSCCCLGDVCRNYCQSRWSRLRLCMQDCHWGYPEEFCELPLGARLYAHLNVQVANGTAAQMVLYRYDFYDGIFGDSFRLNQHGLKRLKEMVRMLQCNIYPIIVEQTPEEPGLAAARRNHVLKSIEQLGFAVPQEWVVVDEPESAGLGGAEAVGIDLKMLQGAKPAVKTTETTGLMFNQKTTEEPPTR